MIWRIPGMPVQGWDFQERIDHYTTGYTTVAIHPFDGETQLYRVSSALDEEEVTKRLHQISQYDRTDVNSPSNDDHVAKVNQVIDIIRNEGLRKVVIARKEVMEIDLDVTSVFKTLCSTYESAIVYVLYVEGELWIGATPETLLTAGEDGLQTMSLAGTRKHDGPAFTDKEYDEQLAVTESIEDVLLTLGCDKIVARGPVALDAGPIQHLHTTIEASLPASGYSIDWATALHPTPAVCGMPKARAQEIISEVEDFDRSLYAGFIGWISDENARYYVNLRCMQVGKNHVALYAGGGITAQSDAESEYRETVNKLETLKSVINNGTPIS